ncbi:zinc finger, CCHC-type containing protein [Tanacetum coccineum]
MHFLLSNMSVVYVLTTPIPEDCGDDETMEQIRKRNKWDNDDYAKYMAGDASSKKFLVNNFTNYKMTNSRPVMEECNELLGILDFKHTLKHKKEKLTLVELGSHLRIKESLKVQDNDKPKGSNADGPSVVRLPDPKLNTLGERGIECIFLGYAEYSKAFRFYVIEPNDSVAINSIIESRDAIFDENRFSSVPRPCLNIPKGTEDIGSSVVHEVVTDEKKVINDEMDSIMGNNTWVLDDLPPGCKPLGCKWIFKRKLKVDRTIEKFKARLQGFKQKLEIDYFDTYAPVARISTIRLLIAMASIHNLIIHQMDVKTIFLNGDLDEKVYMNQPQGLIMPGNENKSKFDESGKGVIICLYVDDMLIFGTDIVQLNLTKEFLSSKFSMKDMGEADVILVSTPMDTSEKLMLNNVGKLSRYTSNHGTQHWQAIQQVLKYLKKNIDYRLTYTGYPLVLEGYTDASWISNIKDNSSTSGWVFLLSGGVISWAFKKQTCITGSTMEYEFVALAAVGKEVEWLKNLLLEIPLWSKTIAPISIHYDSVATLAKAYSQMYNGKCRHLGVRHNMIRELIMNGVISIEFVRSQQNLADHLTKGLSKDLVIKSAEGMRLKSN